MAASVYYWQSRAGKEATDCDKCAEDIERYLKVLYGVHRQTTFAVPRLTARTFVTSLDGVY